MTFPVGWTAAAGRLTWAAGANVRSLPVDWYALPFAEMFPAVAGDPTAAAWEFWLPIKLERVHYGENRFVLQRRRKLFEADLRAALCKALGVASWAGLVELGRAPARPAYRVCLAIERRVPSRRNFILDDGDNLPYSAKPIQDALKRTGLIREDRSAWLRTQPIRQLAIPDTRPVTVLRLWPDPEEPVCLPLATSPSLSPAPGSTKRPRTTSLSRSSKPTC